MNREDQLYAVDQVCRLTTHSHPADTKTALHLLNVLRDDPNAFLEVYAEAVLEESPYRKQAEELMARFGVNATFADMRAIAAEHQQQHDQHDQHDQHRTTAR